MLPPRYRQSMLTGHNRNHRSRLDSPFFPVQRLYSTLVSCRLPLALLVSDSPTSSSASVILAAAPAQDVASGSELICWSFRVRRRCRGWVMCCCCQWMFSSCRQVHRHYAQIWLGHSLGQAYRLSRLPADPSSSLVDVIVRASDSQPHAICASTVRLIRVVGRRASFLGWAGIAADLAGLDVVSCSVLVGTIPNLPCVSDIHHRYVVRCVTWVISTGAVWER